MTTYLKNVNLKKYTSGIFQHLLTSQFIYATPENCIRLKRLRFKIQTRKLKKIHYMYLWLLTKRRPYLQKFHSSWKNISKNNPLKIKMKTHCLNVTLKKKNNFAMLHKILIHMISKQTHSEKQVWTFDQHLLKVILFSVPLTQDTYLLQKKNTYFPQIPLTLIFYFSNTTAFQKLFFVRALRILSSLEKITSFRFFYGRVFNRLRYDF